MTSSRGARSSNSCQASALRTLRVLEFGGQTITVAIEQQQLMIAGRLEVAIVRAVILLAINPDRTGCAPRRELSLPFEG